MSSETFEQAVATALLSKCFPRVPVMHPITVDPLSTDHAYRLLKRIKNGVVAGSKANRHIGWAQAVLCQNEGFDLGFMKDLNAACSALTSEVDDG